MGGSELLARYRSENGLSRAALARLIGVTEQAIYYWERGERVPERWAAREISRVAGVPEGAWPVSRPTVRRHRKVKLTRRVVRS